MQAAESAAAADCLEPPSAAEQAVALQHARSAMGGVGNNDNRTNADRRMPASAPSSGGAAAAAAAGVGGGG
jgi:hypothetical protein